MRFLSFCWDRIVLEVVIRVVERSFGFGGNDKWEARNVGVVARRSSASPSTLVERVDACPPKSSVV